MDKYIDSFLEEFEEPQSQRFPDKAYIESFNGKLPETLLLFWEQFGFCSFLDGLFWVVDPADYNNLVKEWLERAGINNQEDNLYVIARSGYGDLYVWNEKQGRSYEINSMNAWIIKPNTDSTIDLGKQAGLFFATKSPYSVDIEDVDTDEEMFGAAVEKFGKLKSDEIFGFVPTLVTGGDMTFENLQKVNLQIHLDLILQFTEPKVITIDDLTRMAFN
jgi:hypothetical protein